MYYDSVAKAVIVPGHCSSSELKEQEDACRKSSIAHAKTASRHFKTKEYDKAVQAFTAAIKEYPKDSSFYSNRALCHLELGNYENVIADCNIALQFDPGNIKALYRKSLGLFGLQRNSEAMASLFQTYFLGLSDLDLIQIEEKIGIILPSLPKDEQEQWNQRIDEVKVQMANCNGAVSSSSNPTNPTFSKTIFVENFSGSEKDLKKLIELSGEIVHIAFDRKPPSVTLSTPEQAGTVFLYLQGYEFDGKKLSVSFKDAVSDIDKGVSSLAINSSSCSSVASKRKGSSAIGQKIICLKQLPEICNEDDLREIAGKYGYISAIKINRQDRAGFVEFNNAEQALEASKSMNGMYIFGFPVSVRLTGNENMTPAPERRDLRTLWLGNVCPEMNDQSIMRMFQRFRPTCATVFPSSKSGFVNFGNENDAADAMRELQGAKIKKWVLKIEYKIMKS